MSDYDGPERRTMYVDICRERFARMEEKVDKVTNIVTNGLKGAVDRIEEDIKSIQEEALRLQKDMADREDQKRDHLRNWLIAVFGVITPVLFGALGWMMVQLWKHVVNGS